MLPVQRIRKSTSNNGRWSKDHRLKYSCFYAWMEGKLKEDAKMKRDSNGKKIDWHQKTDKKITKQCCNESSKSVSLNCFVNLKWHELERYDRKYSGENLVQTSNLSLKLNNEDIFNELWTPMSNKTVKTVKNLKKSES